MGEIGSKDTGYSTHSLVDEISTQQLIREHIVHQRPRSGLIVGRCQIT